MTLLHVGDKVLDVLEPVRLSACVEHRVVLLKDLLHEADERLVDTVVALELVWKLHTQIVGCVKDTFKIQELTLTVNPCVNTIADFLHILLPLTHLLREEGDVLLARHGLQVYRVLVDHGENRIQIVQNIALVLTLAVRVLLQREVALLPFVLNRR